MTDKRRATVTARFELVASAAPYLEAMLRAMTQQVSCTLLEVKTDVEPTVLENTAADPVGPAGAGSGSTGDAAEALGVEDRAEPLGGRPDDGAAGSVLRAEVGDLTDYASTLDEVSASADSADSGLREETSGDSVIVATKE